METGRFRDRIRFEVRTLGEDSTGQETESWDPIATAPEVWARIEPLPGDEVFAAAGEVTTRPHQVRIRYRADAVGFDVRTHRLVDVRLGTVHDIQAPIVDVDGQRRELEILTVVHG